MMFSAVQSVGNVNVSRDVANRLITVSYTLDEPGIVTVAFSHNGTAIPEERFAGVTGDVNKYVAATGQGETRKIRWQTDLDWPDTFFEGTISAEVTAWTTNNPPDYVVIDLVTMTNSAPYEGARYYTSTNALPGGLFDDRYFSEKLVMRKIPAAGVVWRMGSPDDEKGRITTVEGLETRHRVKLTKDYYIAVFETTYGQSAYFFPETSYSGGRVDPSGTGNPRYALGKVAYYYLRTPEKVGRTNYENPDSWLIIGALWRRFGVKLDIPTEAQWEFACRAGTGTPFYNGYSLPTATTYAPASVREIGWIYNNNSTNADDGAPYGPRPVGLKKPNAWGLYDMIGNVAEFCYDPYGAYIVEENDGISVDPVGGDTYDSTNKRVLRGGYYNQSANQTRSATRNKEGNAGAYTGYGFRLVCPVTLY